MLSATPFEAFCECKDKPKFLFCKIFPQKNRRPPDSAFVQNRSNAQAVRQLLKFDTRIQFSIVPILPLHAPTRCATRRRAPRSAYPARPHSGNGNRLPGNFRRRHRVKTQCGRRGSTVDAVGLVDQFRGRNVATVQMQKHILHRRRRTLAEDVGRKEQTIPSGIVKTHVEGFDIHLAMLMQREET